MVQLRKMRKRLIPRTSANLQTHGEDWYDLEQAATVEVTSEDKDFLVELSFSIDLRQGWRAAEPGPQTIRLLFDEAQALKRIALVFEESEIVRTQECALRASTSDGRPSREIVRQQWNFSPPTSELEIEEYCVELSDVTALELTILPDISGGTARASLKSLRLSV